MTRLTQSHWFALFLVVLTALPSSRSIAADLVTLAPQTWDEFAPQGKESDAIYGDFVLRNDQIVAVIANPVPDRNANMSVRNAGGSIIDLTRIDPQNDQLCAYYPGARQYTYKLTGFDSQSPTLNETADVAAIRIRATSVTLRCSGNQNAGKATVDIRYTLEDGWKHILVETTFSNPTDKPIKIGLSDLVRAERTFEKSPEGPTDLFYAYDKWFGQAYGVITEGHEIRSMSDVNNSTVRFIYEGKNSITLSPGESHSLSRRIFVGPNLIDIKSAVRKWSGLKLTQIHLQVIDTAGDVVPDADVIISENKETYAWGRTGADGKIAFDLLFGKYEITASALGGGSRTVSFHTALEPEPRIELEVPGYVVARITGERGGPIPCKVEFKGKEGTGDPFLGPDTAEHGVQNLMYSENGHFRQRLGPGRYDVIISHGPEYDAVFTEIEIVRGRETTLSAKLVRSVQTPGWISADFHSHSTPSGDTSASQLGRVLNLLCENIEFAPCTEHNRLSTYIPHLRALGVMDLMATCTGLELTNNPLPVNHQNAFPLIIKPHLQDEGAPLRDGDPEIQIERLALWDNNSDKLVQENHPDIGWVFFDKNGDGKPDGGFKKMFSFMDAIEVHPTNTILRPAIIEEPNDRKSNNRIFNWMQLLNQGFRIPGVVNTDAHYNFHGSGFLRNYIKSPTDDPAKIATLDVVHATERGNIIITNGPYLEVQFKAEMPGPKSEGTAGDDVIAPDGKGVLHVRVQCSNWIDVDRVQVLLNGKPDPTLNFTRESHPDVFGSGVVKFEREIPLQLKGDTHIIVAAIGEKHKLGIVMGPQHGEEVPAAVSNPIFVDVDGGGFKANGDTLGAPLPARRER